MRIHHPFDFFNISMIIWVPPSFEFNYQNIIFVTSSFMKYKIRVYLRSIYLLDTMSVPIIFTIDIVLSNSSSYHIILKIMGKPIRNIPLRNSALDKIYIIRI